MTDAELEAMSVKDLRELRDLVDAAIRAHIAKLRSPLSTGGAAPAHMTIDLERERDAWQARKGRT